MGQRWSLDSIFVRESRVGTAGPGLVSVLKPNAPPNFSLMAPEFSQYEGGTYWYGPVIFTPEGPVTVVGVAEAEEMAGLGHSVSLSTSRYSRSTSGGGGLSPP